MPANEETFVDGRILKAPKLVYWTKTKNIWTALDGSKAMSMPIMEIALARTGQSPHAAHTEDWVLLPEEFGAIEEDP